MKTHLAAVLLAMALTVLVTRTPSATPRLAATYGQDCQLCHVNPSGGGLRSSYVTGFIGPAELTLKPLPAHEKSRWPQPKLNDQISVGTDLRLLYLASDNARTAVGDLDNTFFQMQGDFYIAFEPDPQFVLYLDRGTGSEYEVFALARILPGHGYLKGGRFIPDIGWRWDDHNRYTREKLDLDFPGATETGLEVGAAPGPLSASAGIYNGNDGSPFDDNPQKMIVGRALYRWRMGGVNAALGGSTRWNRGNAVDERVWGVQAEAGWRQFAYVGDFFARRADGLQDSLGRAWSWIMSQELDYRPIQGLDVYLGYDFFDRNLDFEDGAEYQLSFGSRVYIRHFFKVEPIFRYERLTTAASVTEDKRLEILLHAFY